METYHHIDWLSATFPLNWDINLLSRWVGKWKDNGRGVAGYQSGMISEYGALALTDGDAKQGTHIILSGDVLSIAKSTGLTDQRLCQFVVSESGKSSRVDVAVDIWNGGITVQQIIEAFDAGLIKTYAKKALEQKEHKAEGHTVYFGAPSSERRFRAYNKGAELGLELIDWLRLELQTRKDRSRALTIALAEQPTTDVVSAAIADYVDWQDPRYQHALKDQNATIAGLPRNAPNFISGYTAKWFRQLSSAAVTSLKKTLSQTLPPLWKHSNVWPKNESAK